VLVLAGAGAGTLDPLGTALALGAAVVYSAYILIGDQVAGRMRPRVLAALVCTGAALTLSVGAAMLGELRPGELTPAGWAWLGCLAIVSTVAAINLFFAGLEHVGPTTASILSTVEPVVTVLLAFLVFGEVLGVVQLLGGALVLGAVLVLTRKEPFDEQATDGQGRAGRRGDARRRPRHRRRAWGGGRHGVRDGAQHARAAL